jgi:hypothetical protein
MKKFILVMMLCGCLFGCQRNPANSTDSSNTMDNIVEDVEEGTQDVVNGLEDMLNDIKDQGISMDSYEKIEHTGLNAYEAYTLKSNGHHAYLYRLNTSDEQMQKLIDHVKQTGTAEVMIENEKKQYEAAVNGNVLLLYDKESDMSDFRKAFEQFKSSTSTAKTEIDK